MDYSKTIKLYNQENNSNNIFFQIVWDNEIKKARFDILLINDLQNIHEDIHIDLTRKQAIELIKILENHILHNRK